MSHVVVQILIDGLCFSIFSLQMLMRNINMCMVQCFQHLLVHHSVHQISISMKSDMLHYVCIGSCAYSELARLFPLLNLLLFG